MKKLGAIIAGGKASRFGGDKAAAMLNGRPLIEHVAEGLRGQVDSLIICGREWPGIECVADRPTANLGPLGGINAALHYAQRNGFDYVLTAGCDVLPIPEMPRLPNDGKAAFIDNHFLFGLWPTSLAGSLDAHLEQQSDHSMRHWIATIGAQPIQTATQHYNLNTQTDLANYAAQVKAAA